MPDRAHLPDDDADPMAALHVWTRAFGIDARTLRRLRRLCLAILAVFLLAPVFGQLAAAVEDAAFYYLLCMD